MRGGEPYICESLPAVVAWRSFHYERAINPQSAPGYAVPVDDR